MGNIPGIKGSQTSATMEQFPKHSVADLSNFHPSVPDPVRYALRDLAFYIESLERPGRDPKTAASRLSSLVADINVLVR